MPIISYIDAITMALKEEMERDDKVFILGEDVGKKVAYLKRLLAYMTNLVKTEYSIHHLLNRLLPE